MKERVLVTALSICVLLAMCPNAAGYLAESDFHIADLVQELGRIQEEVSEKDTSVFGAENQEDTSEETSIENSSFHVNTPAQQGFSIYSVCSRRNGLPTVQGHISADDLSVISLRAPPMAA